MKGAADVVVAGGGPAGALAAYVLARAGVQVRVIERHRFPRPKLCGDTLNPGALAALRRHVPVAAITKRGLPIGGMVLTGPTGVTIDGAYGPAGPGLAIVRSELDAWLLSAAADAGAVVEEGTLVTGPAIRDGRVGGVVTRRGGVDRIVAARLTIGADGRRSRLALGLGLSRHPARPRRWAIGAYFDGVPGTAARGEMHVGRGSYVGVAPLPGGLTNACLVVGEPAARQAAGAPAAALMAALTGTPRLAARFAGRRPVAPPVLLGPLAVDVTAAGVPGLLLAGDAAGFIDPITGDGLRLAFGGAEYAAEVALDVLGGRLDIHAAPAALAARRLAAFRAKWRFNRALRRLLDVPGGVRGAAWVARAWPRAFAEIIRFAGDCSTWTRVSR